MRSLFKLRTILLIVGFALIAWFIWWAWAYFEIRIGNFPPDSVLVRLTVIGLVLVLWLMTRLARRLRSARAGAKLMAAVVKQSDAKERPSAEALQLRERFEESVAALKGKKRGSHTLYELPWYIIIGAPGSGKTTALVNSGLHFPIEQRSGRGALRGVGGTRNCDWWFTDEAVFLDTAGRYTTQDSDAASDSAAWGEFLSLLKKYRQRRPVNGVLVAMSAQDLMVQGTSAREEHLNALRRRLEELNQRLGIQLPVYLLVTKCDLVAGFTEYFNDLTQDGRAQVWGVTFPYEVTRNSEAPKAFPEEFDALIERLNERVYPRVQDEGDPRRRARAFGFPQQMAALRGPLTELVAEVFGSTRFDKTILLRGVYFTSGTQEGTPIDRLLGAIGRKFAVAPDAIVQGGRGKAYFIERLLKEVAIPESGLAGVNRRLEVKKAAAQFGAYAAMIALAVLGVLALSISYASNTSYIGKVQAAVAELQAMKPVPRNASMELMLPRLNAVQHVYDVANEPNESVPWSMWWGLYQGRDLGADARELYLDMLNGPLLTQVANRFLERFDDYVTEPLVLYDYLKGFLILLDPDKHPNPEFLRRLAEQEWQTPSAAESQTGPVMLAHFNNLLAQPRGLRPIAHTPERDAMVSRARIAVRQASIAQLAYKNFQDSEANVTYAVRLDEKAGLQSDQVLRRKDGVSLSTPVPGIYTKPVFEQLAMPGTLAAAIDDHVEEQWVWGGDLPATNSGQLQAEFLAFYEKDYIDQWMKVVSAIDVQRPGNPEQATRILTILAGPTSPLRNFLRTVDEQTYLIKPPDPKKAESGGFADNFKKKTGEVLAPIVGSKPAAPITDQARLRISARFNEIHQLVMGEGGTAPIDRVLGQLQQLQEKVKGVGGGVGKASPLDPGKQAEINEATQALQATASSLPGPVAGLVKDVAGSVESVVLRDIRGDLTRQYAQAVAVECNELVGGRYPLVRGAREATPGDFGRVFGYGGTFDKFFSSTLDGLVDTSTRPWMWRRGIGDATPGPQSMLQRFELARYIRDNFFRPGSQMLELSFRVTAVELDPQVKRFLLQIDGQPFEYQHGPVRTIRLKWPDMTGEAVATFYDGSPVPPSISQSGNWAFFKLMDEAADISRESETRHVLTLRSNNRFVRILFEADSNRNPFYRREMLQQFQCGA